MAVTGDDTESGPSTDMSAYQICSSASSLSQDMMITASPDTMDGEIMGEEVLIRKRELRLLKNRQAAKKCRLRRTAYVKSLENRNLKLEEENLKLKKEIEYYKNMSSAE